MRYLKVNLFWRNQKLILFFLFFFIIHFCCQLALFRVGEDKNLIVGDGVIYYSVLRSAVFDRDLKLGNEYERFGENLASPDIIRANIGGGYYKNMLTVGPAILWLPFFGIAHAAVKIFNVFGGNIPADGFSFPYQYSAAFGTLVYVLIGLGLCVKMMKFYFNKEITFLAVVGVFLASSLVYYTLIEASMAHGASFFVIALLFYRCLFYRDESSAGYWFSIGILGGLAFLMRYQDLAFLIIPGFFAFFYFINLLKKMDYKAILVFFRNLLFCLFAITIAAAPQFLFWKILYGSFLSYPFVVRTSIFQADIFSSLFSSWQGLFTITPITLPAVMGLFLLNKRNQKMALALLLCLVVQIYIDGMFRSATLGLIPRISGLGDAFGARRLVNCAPIFIFGLAALLDWLMNNANLKKVFIYSLLSIFIVWNALFMVQYKLNLIPSDDYLNFKEMVTDKFTLPFMIIEHIKGKV